MVHSLCKKPSRAHLPTRSYHLVHGCQKDQDGRGGGRGPRGARGVLHARHAPRVSRVPRAQWQRRRGGAARAGLSAALGSLGASTRVCSHHFVVFSTVLAMGRAHGELHWRTGRRRGWRGRGPRPGRAQLRLFGPRARCAATRCIRANCRRLERLCWWPWHGPRRRCYRSYHASGSTVLSHGEWLPRDWSL